MRWNLPPDRCRRPGSTWRRTCPTPLHPPLHPATRQPVGPDDLAPLFPMALIAQEVSRRAVDRHPRRGARHPAPVAADAAGAGRAASSEALGTPARIYYKDESVSPAGSHKPNTAVPQAFYNKQEGIARLTTETGAGQWGSALVLRVALFGLECKVYMVRASYDQKPYRRVMMETWGGIGRPVAGRRPRPPRLARHGHQRRGARRGGAGRHATTRSARCSTTSCCTRR